MAEQKYVDWDGLVYYDGKNKEYIRQQLTNLIKLGGEVTFEELHVEKYSPSFDNLNYIYKITNEFVADDWFESSIRGNIYPAGTWIMVAEYDLTYLYTIFSEPNTNNQGEVDLTPIYSEIDSLKNTDNKIKSDIQRINTKFSDYATIDEVEELSKEIDSNNSKINDIEVSVDDNSESIEEINNKLDAIEDAVSDNKTTLDLIVETNNEQSEAIDELTESFNQLSNKIDNIIFDTSDLATKKELEELEAKIPEVPTKLSELENDTGYVTDAWVNNQGFAKLSDIPQSELFVVDYNAPDFAAALEAYNTGKLLLLTNVAPDPTGYAVMNYVRDDLITFTKFLISRSETYGAFNTYYLHNDNTWELAKEVKLNKVDAIVDDNNDITGLTIGKNTYQFDNFATTEVINQITEDINNIENTYVTNQTLEENYITIADGVTKQDVNVIVEKQVEATVKEEIETTVETVIQEKVDAGEITVATNAITYGEF